MVPIVTNHKGETISDCLNCENKQLEKEMNDFVREMDAKEHEITYERYSIIPEDLENASFENYIPEHPTQKEAFKKAQYYADFFGELDFTSLLFKGTYGIGKSHLAKAISDVVKAKGLSVIYIDLPGLLRKIRKTFNGKESADSIYEAIEKADLVVFDDLGAEYVKQDNGESWVGEVLFEMFSSRTGKPKIITTNCGSAELKAMYGKNGPRIVSRMMKGTKAIQIDGKDMRTEEF
ncbi:hypothetical protein BKM15_25800 [Pseudomonas syringae pv. syringae]|nr:hypothetical protein BKM15_25800 [Pseudomonas syringae pv. syringae]